MLIRTREPDRRSGFLSVFCPRCGHRNTLSVFALLGPAGQNRGCPPSSCRGDRFHRAALCVRVTQGFPSAAPRTAAKGRGAAAAHSRAAWPRLCGCSIPHQPQQPLGEAVGDAGEMPAVVPLQHRVLRSELLQRDLKDAALKKLADEAIDNWKEEI